MRRKSSAARIPAREPAHTDAGELSIAGEYGPAAVTVLTLFLRMLAHHVEWHMRRALAPLLFDDDDPDAAEAQRASPAAPAKPSPVPPPFRPRPSGSSASNRDPYPVAHTRNRVM